MPVRVKLIEKDQEFRLATIEDISWGGVLLMVDPLPALGTRLVLQFLITDEAVTLEVLGTVVRQRPAGDRVPPGIGVQFDALDDDTKILLQRLIAEEVRALLRSV